MTLTLTDIIFLTAVNTVEKRVIDVVKTVIRGSGGGTPDKKMSQGHLPRVIYHQVYNVY